LDSLQQVEMKVRTTQDNAENGETAATPTGRKEKCNAINAINDDAEVTTVREPGKL